MNPLTHSPRYLNANHSATAACEPLEGRRLLTTWQGDAIDGFASIPGVTATATGSTTGSPIDKVVVPFKYEGRYSPESVSVTLANLPAHSMVHVYVNGASGDSRFFPDGSSDASDGFTVEYAGEKYTYKQGYGPGYDSPRPPELLTTSGRLAEWIKHDSGSLTIKMSQVGLESGEYILFDYLQVSVYQPTVSVTGGGTTSEDATEPTTFTLGRDLPAGHDTAYGDDAVPDTEVSLTRDGTAKSGTDYTSDLPTSVVTTLGGLLPTPTPDPTLKAKLEGGAASKTFSITPIWEDSGPEPTETVILTATAGSGYTLGTASSQTLSIDNTTPFVTLISGDTTIRRPAPGNIVIEPFKVAVKSNLAPKKNVEMDVKLTSVPPGGNALEKTIALLPELVATNDNGEWIFRVVVEDETVVGDYEVEVFCKKDPSVKLTVKINIRI